MEHDTQIAISFTEHPNGAPASLPLDHDYRQRWWLPVIGPTASCLLDLISSDPHQDWRIHYIDELSTSIGIGYKKSHRQLTATLDRLVRFGFASYVVAPDDPDHPVCIAFHTTTTPVPHRHTRTWPPALQSSHEQAIVALNTN